MLLTALKSAGRSDPGRVRGNNEDAFYIDADRGIFLVVDGIGGHNAGEKAAAIAVERIKARLERQTGAPEVRIREAVAIANNEIFAASKTNPDWEGMACVLTLALIENGTAYIGHVGDSRLYLIRRGEIRKVTRDHSPVGEREDAGEIGEAEAMRHPRRNEVFRDVGSEEHAPEDANFIDIERIPFDAETALLLCSDGLSDQVTAEDIRKAVERYAGDPDHAAHALIEAANAAGGKDNVTVVIVEGERFSSFAVPGPVKRPHRRIRSIALYLLNMVATGVITGVVIFKFYHPEPVIIEPRTLTAGPGAAYDSITSALNAARSGDTVEVLSGEYREHVFLKSGVTLRSHVAREARLIASEGNNAAVTANDVEHGRLEGFLISADAQNPLEFGMLVQNSSVTIVNNEIEGAGTGVEIAGPRAPELTANAFRNCAQAGVAMQGLVNPWLFHNSFQDNRTAISVDAEAHPQLVGNVFDKTPVNLPPDISQSTIREHNFFLDLRTPARQSSSTKKGKEK